ncbi:hypothetical protein [Streptomyces sp. NPDC001380]|uniref:hypothetical protein n=1 Tax=Streptomyces sp. NPDC001380 TaxID=3364566 RepID=UPI00367FF635
MTEEHGTDREAGGRRRSSRRVEARERARLQAAQYVVREEARQRIAAEYLLLQEDLVRGRRAADERLARLREELEAPLTALREQADSLVLDMLETGVGQVEAAGRLGMPLPEVRRIRREHEQRAQQRRAAPTGAEPSGTAPAALPGQSGPGHSAAAEDRLQEEPAH